MSLSTDPQVIHAKPVTERKRIIGSVNKNQIPSDILDNKELNHSIATRLPNNYNFEFHKIIWRLKTCNARRVGLQFPEGLFVFAITIADIIEHFAEVDVIIMGDVTYGACCVEDLMADAMDCDFIVHFGHSCLIPVNQMVNNIKVLYVFVDIKIDLWHLIETIKTNFNPQTHYLSISGTVQFVSSIHSASKELRQRHGFQVLAPQAKPLSPGEVLGCTAPQLPQEVNTIIFVADGRFHLEALMIANPSVNAFKYNPYNKEITQEFYDFNKMMSYRKNAINSATKVCTDSGVFGIILGTLGRQGNPKVLENLKSNICKFSKCQTISVLLPEIRPEVLGMFTKVDAWVQIACPRLSIDWGNNFTHKPLLTPFELNVTLNTVTKEFISLKSKYAMDFYETNSSGNWTPNHKCNQNCCCNENNK
ncbi:2-(3-amino-3-carboxypropyl)histidine synthase subunit 1-like [Oppia nitens]|uniref:2-(3-amino-3-carboxypropyl)histidine synthase subunit 1-like n=1 Tax=Oppia nitens TaxID=1686743 RepID=UPI0023DC1EBE|nr:2-(3-amino-3-carboxypropyl)histidine synthase subunit 1-like [Oppia nitens]